MKQIIIFLVLGYMKFALASDTISNQTLIDVYLFQVGFIGAATSSDVYINDTYMGRLSVNKYLNFNLPRENYKLKVINKVNGITHDSILYLDKCASTSYFSKITFNLKDNLNFYQEIDREIGEKLKSKCSLSQRNNEFTPIPEIQTKEIFNTKITNKILFISKNFNLKPIIGNEILEDAELIQILNRNETTKEIMKDYKNQITTGNILLLTGGILEGIGFSALTFNILKNNENSLDSNRLSLIYIFTGIPLHFIGNLVTSSANKKYLKAIEQINFEVENKKKIGLQKDEDTFKIVFNRTF